MPTIMLFMIRNSIMEGLMNKLQDSPYISVVHEADYDNAKLAIGSHNPNVALLEVTESGHYDMSYCLALCKELRKIVPKCKLLVMCSEQDEESVKQVVEAKGKNEIDDFVFLDVTIDYLASKLIST